MVLQVGHNGRLEISHAFEDAAANGILGDEAEEALDLIEPGGGGGREVNVPTRPAGEPSSDLGMLVAGVVVDDEMDVELVRHIGLDVAQESEELLMTMARFALAMTVPSSTLRAANRVVVPWRW